MKQREYAAYSSPPPPRTQKSKNVLHVPRGILLELEKMKTHGIEEIKTIKPMGKERTMLCAKQIGASWTRARTAGEECGVGIPIGAGGRRSPTAGLISDQIMRPFLALARLCH